MGVLVGVNLALLSCLARSVWGESVATGTRYGSLQGTKRIEHYDIAPGAVTHVVDQYLGVPYAGPVTGGGRFQLPVKPESWEGIRAATSHGPPCPQVPYYSQTLNYLQSENCLNLNIYVPVVKGKGSGPYPVMVFIHGGSYEEGSGNRYDGFPLAQHGVLVACVNYRLGELGYLSTGDGTLSGNYGLLDQIQALKWIHENIHSFNGDPAKVTVFGSSAGASSIGLLLVAPAAKGLFSGAILQSGSPLASWATYNQTSIPLDAFVKVVARGVGCPDDVIAGIDCLRNIPHKNISAYHWLLPGITPSHLNFKPRIDGLTLPGHPETLFREGRFHDVRVMIGNVKDEWSRSMGWFFKDIVPPEIDTNFTDGFGRTSFERAVRHVITSRLKYPDVVAEIAIQAYTDWGNRDDVIINRENYFRLMGDILMIAPSVHLGNLLKAKTDVFFYMYEHVSHHTPEKWWQTYHSLELDSVFGSPFTGYDIATDVMANYTEKDKKISGLVMELWTNFAKFGEPTPNVKDSDTNKWSKLNSDSMDINHYYITANNSHMRSSLRPGKMYIWNELLPKALLSNTQACSINSTCTDSGGYVYHQDYRLLMWILVVTTGLLLAALLLVCLRSAQRNTKEKHTQNKTYREVSTNVTVQ